VIKKKWKAQFEGKVTNYTMKLYYESENTYRELCHRKLESYSILKTKSLELRDLHQCPLGFAHLGHLLNAIYMF
jgi:hypothetical protein